MEVRAKHIAGDAWEVSLPARKSAVSGRPPVRPRRTVHAPDEEAAIALGEEVLARDYPAYLAGATLDLADLAMLYLDHAEASGIYGHDTARDYRNVVERYVRPNFCVDASEVDPMDIEALYAFLLASGGKDGQGVGANTVRKLNTVLRATYGFLVREGIVGTDPMPAVHAPSYEPRRRRALSERELGRLASALEKAIGEEADILRRNCLFGAYADIWIGARVAEVCAIDRGDIHLARGEIDLCDQLSERGGLHIKPTKTIAGMRTVAPGATCMDAVKGHMAWQRSYLTEEQRESDKTPLCTTEDGGFIRPSTMSAVFKEFCEEVGIELAEGESFHLLRHTNASELLANGVSVGEAQRRLGHKRASTTLDNYGHAVASESPQAAARIEEAIRAAKEEEGAW